MEAPPALATTFLFLVPGTLLAWDRELPSPAIASVSLGSVRAAVRTSWLAARRQDVRDAYYQELRSQYEVRLPIEVLP